jgi:N-acetylmuramoyl-L-alanine amidase
VEQASPALVLGNTERVPTGTARFAATGYRPMLTPEWTPLLTVIQMISAVASWHPEAADVDRHDALCLARNIYFEARGEGARGQYAVAAVTLNRVRDKRWADGICGVVYQDKQFSWTISRPMSRPTVIEDRAAWQRAAEVAVLSLVGLAPDYSQGATHYIAPKLLRRMPVWTTAMAVSRRIDGHVFFAERNASAKNPTAKIIPARGPRRNTPRITAVALSEPAGATTFDPLILADARARIGRGSVRRACGSLHLLPIVNVEAAALLNGQMPVPVSHRRPGNRNTPYDPWTDSVGTATERRIRTGARRAAAV